GSDVARIDHPDQLGDELLERLAQGPRVLKQHRGHSGIGVWRVELTADDSRLVVRPAQRGSVEARIDVATLRDFLRPYFDADAGGHLIDQAWQPRIGDGMMRAYLVGTEVVGFGHQAVNARHPDIAQPGPRHYHGPNEPAFQPLRTSLESGWITMMCETVGLETHRVPLLWDCDFMHGDPQPDNPNGYVLCEVNVSSVAPYPPSAIEPLVNAVRAQLDRLAAP
ncbi:MAG TPA: Cj0069 family protein, partial [Ilumatobacteraceae bacterium]|nr:Cj0069 family protein [Ilumatobacteraceae bacterium]